MSLVILSNQETNQDLNTDSEWEKPYSFNNALKETMVIPPNSQVALQSIKVNKSGSITLQGSETFFSCVGIDLNAVANKDIEIHQTTMNPIRTNIRTSDSLYQETLSIEEMADKMSLAMDRGLPHPDMYGLQKCSIRNDSAGKFEGLNLEYTSGGDMGDTSNQPALTSAAQYNLTMLVGGDPLDTRTLAVTTVASGTQFLSNANPIVDPEMRFYANEIIMKQNPLSHYNGEMRIDLTDVVVDQTDFVVDQPCAFGLTRSNAVETIDPDYFDTDQEYLNSGIETIDTGNIQFFDYVIRLEQKQDQSTPDTDFYLWIGQSSVSPDAVPIHGGDEDVFCMREVFYYEWDTTTAAPTPGTAKSSFTARYNMTTNTLKINQFKFQIDGEMVNLWYHTGTFDDTDAGFGDTNNGGAVGTWTILSSFTQASKSDWELLNINQAGDLFSYKEHIPKPIGQQTWNLYPKIFVGSSVRDKGVVMSKWGGRVTTVADFSDNDRDYYLRMENTGNIGEIKALEGRSMFIMGGGEIDPIFAYFFPMKGMAAGSNNLPETFGYNVMLGESIRYKFSTGANIKSFLGFSQSVLTNSTPPTFVGDIATYKGDSAPVFSQTTLFVRLNNFTQISYNAGIGRPSKVIYVMPRFDNSGREDGSALYFEPAQRIYLDLGNTETLYINDFDVTIVDSRERLSRSLTGTTVMCLHIKQKDM